MKKDGIGGNADNFGVHRWRAPGAVFVVVASMGMIYRMVILVVVASLGMIYRMVILVVVASLGMIDKMVDCCLAFLWWLSTSMLVVAVPVGVFFGGGGAAFGDSQACCY